MVCVQVQDVDRVGEVAVQGVGRNILRRDAPQALAED